MRKEQKQFIKECVQAAIDGAVDLRFTMLECRMDTQNEQIKNIRAREEKNAVTLNKVLKDLSCKNQTLEAQIRCGARTGHHFSVEYTNNCRTSFRCIKCELSYGKDNCDLNEKEKRLLAITLKEEK